MEFSALWLSELRGCTHILNFIFLFFLYHALDRKTERESFTLDVWWDRSGFAFMGLTICKSLELRDGYGFSRATSLQSEGLGRPNCCAIFSLANANVMRFSENLCTPVRHNIGNF